MFTVKTIKINIPLPFIRKITASEKVSNFDSSRSREIQWDNWLI